MLPELSLESVSDQFLAPPRWSGTAVCSEADPELFFPLDEDEPVALPAKAICAGCEVRAQCLAYALTAGMAAGVWGGLSTSERDALVRARQPRRPARRGA
jgi:WhiB family redox-sensing transcriptional regulator